MTKTVGNPEPTLHRIYQEDIDSFLSKMEHLPVPLKYLVFVLGLLTSEDLHFAEFFPKYLLAL